jgi:DNA-binding transcriptional LysR family regulator
MNLRQIEVFNAVMCEGSITKAADVLFVSQPSVSKVIQHAEIQLGFSLFDREGGKLTPTEEAQILYRQSKEVLDDIQRFNKLIEEVRNLKTGMVNIATQPALSTMLMPEVIKSFNSEFPDIGVNIIIESNNDMSDLIRNREVDLALIHYPMDNFDIVSEIVSTGSMVCVLRSDNPLSQQKKISLIDLGSQKYIDCIQEKHFKSLLKSQFPDFEEKVKPFALVNYFEAACALSVSIDGVTIVDEYSAKYNYIPGLTFRPLEKDLKVNIGIVHSAPRQISISAKELIKHIKKVVS